MKALTTECRDVTVLHLSAGGNTHYHIKLHGAWCVLQMTALTIKRNRDKHKTEQ